jgi:hypothetical protein
VTSRTSRCSGSCSAPWPSASSPARAAHALIKVGRRAGDNAEMSVIELVEKTPAAAEGETKKAAE